MATATLLVAIAFPIAPHACEGGLELYFWIGVAAVIAALAIPFVLRNGQSPLVRCALALGLATLVASAWIAGLFAANIRIMCRLF